MLPPALFGSRRFSVAVVSVGLGVFALLGSLFLLTQFLQFSLGYSPLGAGLRILPTAAAGLLLIAAGLTQVAASSSVTSTYVGELPGMLLVGLGAGLLLPATTDSVLGAVTQTDAGVGSATNSMAMQVGGALGVAVLGSVSATRYQHHMRAALVGHHVPQAAAHSIRGSLGGALAVPAWSAASSEPNSPTRPEPASCWALRPPSSWRPRSPQPACWSC
jgi:hypothetical protein